MTIAAVPLYIGQDFSSASPQDRFFTYLPIWTARADQERYLQDRANGKSREAVSIAADIRNLGMDGAIASNKVAALWTKFDNRTDQEAWRNVLKLTADDRKRLGALDARQAALADTLGGTLCVHRQAVSTAPFATGLGIEHPLENGFAFLSPYGLPYLAGSGIKGVLRRAATELADGLFGATADWTAAAITALFGYQSTDGEEDLQRGALCFHDCIPDIKGDLRLDVMTPHQSHYYQKSDSPHESGQPVPVNFLTVPPGSGFRFLVSCNPALLKALQKNGSPDLLANDPATSLPMWQSLINAALDHAFEWLGFGAKTAVGYGAMAEDPRLRRQREEAAAKRAAAEQQAREDALRRQAQAAAEEAEKARRGSMTANARELEDLKALLERVSKLAEIARAQEESALNAAIKPVRDNAAAWPDAEREQAAQLLEQAWDIVGWYARDQKDRAKRKKQEDKKRELIAAIRKGTG